MTAMSSDELIRRLQAAGWRLVRIKGDHHVFLHPDNPNNISVPHPRKDLGKGIAHRLLRKAGLK